MLLLMEKVHLCTTYIMLISKIFQLLPEYATFMVLLCQATPAWSKDKIVSKLLKTGQRILYNKGKIGLRKAKEDQMNDVRK